MQSRNVWNGFLWQDASCEKRHLLMHLILSVGKISKQVHKFFLIFLCSKLFQAARFGMPVGLGDV